MQIKKDEYRAKQTKIMLEHETAPGEVHYAARLFHWRGDTKHINIEADVLSLLTRAYSGEYVEVNEPKDTGTGKRYHFWCLYEYGQKNYPLLFVHLPHLNNRDIVELLRVLDVNYGNTEQETTDWALEYQVLTRMLIHEKALLVNPLHLDLSEEDAMAELLETLPEDDRDIYIAARQLGQEEILEMFREYEV